MVFAPIMLCVLWTATTSVVWEHTKKSLTSILMMTMRKFKKLLADVFPVCAHQIVYVCDEFCFCGLCGAALPRPLDEKPDVKYVHYSDKCREYFRRTDHVD